ncbi:MULTISPECIES: low specificity L-threonine aldolase [Gammaproteobacteria]|uniref:threonine aldolase family protein n=1 Tax=Gammaproteobacteria TaxID=1236 RepID=UPI000DD0DE7B|nr:MULTISPECIES: beta-eliminating lyase-related protein [Gammaproteobacteria]RTE86926.1 threonine aldolase [Aliidiomarina sp. B3213]TCZ93284.1 threonine aldolase [Lysobacter sp. N42]
MTSIAKLRAEYQRVVGEAQHSMLRQPSRTLKQHLQALADFATDTTESDVYGSGELIESLEQDMATLFGKEAACFMPSGTMAQNIALKIYATQKDKPAFACHPTSHLVLHEQAAFEHLWGLEAELIGEAYAPIELADIKTLDPARIAAVVTELPAREIGGQLPPWEDLVKQSRWLKEQGIAFHIDGARLWHCKAAYGKSFAEIGELADSLYLSFYKDLAGISGAVLLGTQAFIDKAKVWQRRAGGNLFSLHPYILSAKLGLEENLDSVDDAVHYAKELAQALNTVPNVEVLPAVPQAAMFHLIVDADEPELMAKMVEQLEASHVQVLPLPREKKNGSLIFEIPVGRAAMSKPVKFWHQHLAQLLQS